MIVKDIHNRCFDKSMYALVYSASTLLKQKYNDIEREKKKKKKKRSIHSINLNCK